VKPAYSLAAILLTISIFPLQAAGHPIQASGPEYDPVFYEISLANPERHLFHVLMKIPNVTGELTVQMPAWNALYQIRDFSSHVQHVDAYVGTAKAPIEKIDKQRWKIRGTGTVRLDYSTYWDEPGPFATQLNVEHAFINPAMVLMYEPATRIGKPCWLSPIFPITGVRQVPCPAIAARFRKSLLAVLVGHPTTSSPTHRLKSASLRIFRSRVPGRPFAPLYTARKWTRNGWETNCDASALMN